MNKRFRIGTLYTGRKQRAIVTIDMILDRGELSITGEAVRPGTRDGDIYGQMQDYLRSAAFQPGFGWSQERVAELLQIWDKWHLNYMRAGCKHQRELGWQSFTEHPSEPCPVCGYKYGSAWLKEELPAEIVAYVEKR